jgi:hypothetical protein
VRRVIAKVEFHFGELFPRVGFIVTNLETDSRTVVRFYHKRGTAAVDQRRQAGGGDDAAELPLIPVQPGALVAERARLQPGEPLAAAGVAEPDRQLVVDEPAAAIGQDGWPIGQARAVLLAALGREPSDQAAFWGDGGTDRRLAGGDGVDGWEERIETGDQEVRAGKVSVKGAISAFWIFRQGENGALRCAKEGCPKTTALWRIKSWRLGV